MDAVIVEACKFFFSFFFLHWSDECSPGFLLVFVNRRSDIVCCVDYQGQLFLLMTPVFFTVIKQSVVRSFNQNINSYQLMNRDDLFFPTCNLFLYLLTFIVR